VLLTIDSSVYLSALLPKDPFKKISQKCLAAIERRKIDVLLPSLIPLEVTHTMHRNGLGREEAELIFQEFYETPHLRVVAIDRGLGSSLLRGPRPEGRGYLKTADWIIAGTCLALKSQLITWDIKLIEQTRAVLSPMTPKQWLG
jgi:predicted nucleic acid-binding protein